MNLMKKYKAIEGMIVEVIFRLLVLFLLAIFIGAIAFIIRVGFFQICFKG